MTGLPDALPLVVGARTVTAVVLLGAAVRARGARWSRRVAPAVSTPGPRRQGTLVGEATGAHEVRPWMVVLATFVVLGAASRGGPAVGIGLAVAGWSLPRRVRAARAERTGRSFDRALPSMLDAWARHVRGGLAPAAALAEAVLGSGGAARRAMAPMVVALQRGAPLEDAVARWWPDRPGPAGSLVRAAVAVSQPLGGLRARGLDAVAATVREHAALDAEKQVQAAQARVSAVVMTVAPLLFCAFLVLSDGAASAFLLRSPVGLVCGSVGIGLDFAAGVWMRSAVRRAR